MSCSSVENLTGLNAIVISIITKMNSMSVNTLQKDIEQVTGFKKDKKK